jgi:DNA-binding Lrp family transcriptional regulator
LLCEKCFIKDTCASTGVTCAALNELYDIWGEQNTKDKTARIRNLRKQLGVRDAEVSKDLRRLAEKIIKHFPEFNFIREFNIRIGYVVSQERKQGEKITYADCRKVQEVYRAYLPYDFIITFYERNTGFLNENQLKVLIRHELKHVGIGVKGLKVKPHDIEDFRDIITEFGLEWNSYGKELPDILGGE